MESSGAESIFEMRPSARPIIRPVSIPSTCASSRSPSSASVRSSASTRSRTSSHAPHFHGLAPPAPLEGASPTTSLDQILAQTLRTKHSQVSLTSLSLQSVRMEMRPSRFSPIEAREEEDACGGRAVLDVLEPRGSVVGFWGVSEVLNGKA